MNTTTNDTINLNDDYYNDLVNAKTISIAVDKLKEFITLLYGDREFIVDSNNINNYTNFIDLRERNLVFV